VRRDSAREQRLYFFIFACHRFVRCSIQTRNNRTLVMALDAHVTNDVRNFPQTLSPPETLPGEKYDDVEEAKRNPEQKRATRCVDLR